MKNRYQRKLLCLAIVSVLATVALAGCIFTENHAPLSPMEVVVFGLGRADAILITTEHHAVMIDTGENQHGPDIVAYLLSQNITTLDYLIITHFDRDHVGGAHHMIDAIDVQTVIVPNYSRDTQHVANLYRAMGDANLEPFVLTEALRFTLDEAAFIIDPTHKPYFAFGDGSDVGDEAPRSNNFSIVVSISHGENDFLFTGDAQSRRMREVMANQNLMRLEYDFLKVPRHGRYMSRSSEFIQTIRPRYAVITDSYERPADEETIVALDAVDAQVFFARTSGIHVLSDGIDLVVVYKDFFALE